MATLPQCPRCKTFYSGSDFCMKCRIFDLIMLAQAATDLAASALQSDRYENDTAFHDKVDKVYALSGVLLR